MVIAVTGMGLLAYALMSFTALVIEGELTKSFRRRKMEKIASNYKDHYIVCGSGLVGGYILDELCVTKRAYVIVDVS